MVPLLLLPLLWGTGLLQEQQGYDLQVKKLVSVQENQCVHVLCSFSYPESWRYPSGNVYTSWYRHGDKMIYDVPVVTNNPHKTAKRETLGRFFLADPSNNSCSLSIRDARKSDSGSYFFQVETYDHVIHTYQDKELILQVTDLTQKPDILILEPLVSGRRTQVTCSLSESCEGGSSLTFSWVGSALDSLNPKPLNSSVLTFTPRSSDHGTNLTCQVTRVGRGLTTQKTIHLNVSYAPQKMTISSPFNNVTALKILQTSSLPILEGEAVHLLCVADSNPPSALSWFRGVPAPNATPISSSAILELPRMEAGEELFTCQAQHPLGSQNISVSLYVVYAPQLLGPSCSWKDRGVSCSCFSRAQPAPSLSWWLGEELLEGSPGNTFYTVTSSSVGPWANSSLSLRLASSASLTLSCKTENVHGKQRATVLLLGPPVSVSRLVPTALGGAGAMALLLLCLCLIYLCIVKSHRKQAGWRPKITNDEDPVMGTVTWDSQQNSGPDGPPNQVTFLEDGSSSIEEQNTQYANLTLLGRKLQEPQDKGATSACIYSEIKTTGK